MLKIVLFCFLCAPLWATTWDYEPQVVLANDETLYILWLHREGNDVHVRASIDGVLTDLSQTNGESNQGQLATDVGLCGLSLWREQGSAIPDYPLNMSAHYYYLQSSFSTTGNWSSTSDISVSDKVSTKPEVSLNNQTVGCAIWQEFDQDKWSVLTRWFNGGDWGSIVALSTNKARKARVTVNEQNEALAAWVENHNGSFVLMGAFCNNGVWQTPQQLSFPTTIPSPEPYLPSITTQASQLFVALNNVGEGIVVWQELSPEGKNEIKMAEVTGGVWGLPEIAISAANDCSNPLVALNESKHLLLCWQESGASSKLKGRFRNESGWGNIATIASEKIDRCELFFDDADSGCIFFNTPGTSYPTPVIGKLYLSLFNTTWAAPTLESDPSKNVFSFDASVNQAGNVVYAWSQAEPTGGSTIVVGTKP